MSAPDGDPMPVFTIKAQDRLAVSTVHAYQKLCMAYGLREQATEVGKALAEFLDWRRRHPDLVKLPDHVHVPVDPHPELVDRDGDTWRWSAGYSLGSGDICTRDEVEGRYGPVVERKGGAPIDGWPASEVIADSHRRDH